MWSCYDKEKYSFSENGFSESYATQAVGMNIDVIIRCYVCNEFTYTISWDL